MITSFFKPKRVRASAGKENDSGEREETTTAVKKLRTHIDPPSKKNATLSPEAKELVSYLNHTNTDSDDSSSWRDALGKHISSPSFDRLATFVAKERNQKTVFPPVEDTFAALNLCPLSKVKVVIVGQDPYHGPGQAHGLCFSVRRGVPAPPSLRNVYKELLNDASIENFRSIPGHGNLERWARQGVLMINNVLTVRRGEAHSHKKKGWEAVTDEIIRAVDRANRRKQQIAEGGTKRGGVVFLLWGKPATEKATTALAGAASRHTIICTSHPSPLGATKTKSPFLGSRCFGRANEALRKMGHEEIDWRVDGPLAQE
ncbi:unnamed protein product [Pseudo-nitzschia multistriata]|uniref:Uracil-DNA glycosylase n=1 Tax=Pseudo-nitzschia multistriata TaxID=183589 RepID=A0A448ZMF2_9STRA|nr:unnamed protein product [Pseudo-nitzschia multistriata]